MRRIAVAALVAALALAAPAMAAKPKSITVTYAGTGGTEHDVMHAVLPVSPVCTVTLDANQDLRDVAWRAKWSHVRLPKRGKRTVAKAPARFSGSAIVDQTMKSDTGCGQAPPQPMHCEPKLEPAGEKVRLVLAWKGKRLQVAVEAFPAEESGEGSETVSAESAQQEEESGCTADPRSAAYGASVLVPRRAARALVTPVDAAINDAGPEDARSHLEMHDAADGYTADMTSDVTWGGVVTVRYNRH